MICFLPTVDKFDVVYQQALMCSDPPKENTSMERHLNIIIMPVIDSLTTPNRHNACKFKLLANQKPEQLRSSWQAHSLADKNKAKMTFAVIENVIIALQPYQLTIDDRQTEGQTDKPTPKLAFRRAKINIGYHREISTGQEKNLKRT